jgi:hypothetical protein
MPAIQDIEQRAVDADLALLCEKTPNKAPAAAGTNNENKKTSTYSENTLGLLIQHIEVFLQFYHWAISIAY